jgi:methyl-accepting chemotaxis protein
MTIASRLLYSFGIMLFAVVAIGAIAAGLTFRTAATVATTLRRSFEAVTVLESLGEQVRQYGGLATGFAAAGAVTEADTIRLEQVEGGIDLSQEALRAKDPASATRVQAVMAEHVERTRSTLGELAAARRPAQPPTPGSAAGRLAGAQLATVNDKTTTALAEVRYALHDLVDARLARVTREAQLFVIALSFLGLGAGAALGVMFAGVRSQVLRPLRALADGARRISAERDLTLAVPVAGDLEVRELGRAFDGLMATLRDITVEMRGATDRLLSAAGELGAITHAQGDSVARQASALEEARRTSLALRESSRVAGSQAEGVLHVAERAEELGRDGQATMAENLSSADAIRGQTRAVVERIGRLATSAQRIAAITATVKDLADQSNLLALNAAIEAARAGEAGLGFGVVAREIRVLADRSIRATVEVRTVLTEVLAGIRESTGLVEAADTGLEEARMRTRRLGDSVAGLTGIVRENLSAVREISSAVASQGAGIGQISTAVEDLAQMMQSTVQSVTATGEAAGMLREVSEQVSSAVKAFRV